MTTSIHAPRQCVLDLPSWGGRRKGAGPKPAMPDRRPALPHRKRAEQRAYHPVHVTFRMRDHVWNLRSQRAFAVIHGALQAVRRRRDFRITHFSIQGNHVHLIVEAEGNRSLSNGVRAFSIRVARGLNGMMGRRGRVFEDRYHAHVLRTPAEARNAVRYAVGNFESHAARRGKRTSGRWVDPFSSSAAAVPRLGQGVLFPDPVTSAARTWLLRSAVGERARGGR